MTASRTLTVGVLLCAALSGCSSSPRVPQDAPCQPSASRWTGVTEPLSNTVFDDSDFDGVKDPRERGHSGATVLVFTSDMTFCAATVTDSDGRYVLDVPATGGVNVRVYGY